MGWETDPVVDLGSELQEIRNRPTIQVHGDYVEKKNVDLSGSIVNRSYIDGVEDPNITITNNDSIVLGSNLPSTRESMTSNLRRELMTPEQTVEEYLQRPIVQSVEEMRPAAQVVNGKPRVEACPSCGNAVCLEEETCCSNCGRLF